jgi:hypothetical protein
MLALPFSGTPERASGVAEISATDGPTAEYSALASSLGFEGSAIR